MRKPIIILCATLLCACANNPATSSVAFSSSNVASSSVVISSEPPGLSAWELTGDALPQNPAQGKHYDLAFSTTNGRGDTVSFIGDAILKGAGSKSGISIDNTIQLSKEEGQIYMTSGSAIYIEIEIARIAQSYGGEEYDYTGIPTLYSANEMTADNGEKVELSLTELPNGHYVYGAMLPHMRFRLANESEYALYIYRIANLG